MEHGPLLAFGVLLSDFPDFMIVGEDLTRNPFAIKQNLKKQRFYVGALVLVLFHLPLYPLWAAVPPILGEVSLGRLLLQFHGAPQVTSEMIEICERIDLGGEEEFRHIARDTFALRSSFFLPFDPQWVQTVPLMGALYEGGVQLLSVIQSEQLSLPETFRNHSLVLHRHLVQKIRNTGSSNRSSPFHLAEVQTIQTNPYSRDHYVVTEFLRQGDLRILDFKRVITISRVPGGSWFSHLVYFRLKENLSGEKSAGIFMQEKDIFLQQNSLLKFQIQRDLAPKFQASFE